jgi:hypothetical protein
MKNSKNHYFNLLFATLILFSLQGCNDSEEGLIIKTEQIPLFSEADLSIINGNSEKSWRITQIINKYYDLNDALEIELSCVQDDTYTFSATSNDVVINLGEDQCFGKNNEGVFIADIEIFSAQTIVMDAASGNTIYLAYSQGFSNEEGNVGGVSIRHYALSELSEDRMVFYREGAELVGEYNEALIFEKI